MIGRLKRGVHRHLWPLLPRGLRRGLLTAATAAMAPKASARADRRGPFIVIGCFRTVSGLGESARLCHDALKASGFEVYGVDVTEALMQKLDGPAFDFADGRSHRGAGTLVVHVNGPLMPLAMLAAGRALVAGKHVVGYWHWELPTAPAEWRTGLAYVHDVWVPSRFTADALRTLDPAMAIHVVPHPIALNPWPQAAGSAGGRPLVVSVFNTASGFSRKNPLGAIAAYVAAFPSQDTARLVMKLSNPEAFPQGSEALRRAIGGREDIDLVERTSTRAEMDALFDAADIVVSLHRSEGFGLLLAEAMLRGIPAVATDWSGTTDFFGAEHGFPVGFQLVPARDPQGVYDDPRSAWADADIAEAANGLRTLAADAVLRARLAEGARRDALAIFGVERYRALVVAAMGIGA